MFPLNLGSSPLARGTRELLYFSAHVLGLIPARAGNTRLWVASGTTKGAHPRSRGEHQSERHPRHRHRGSSPLARGTRLRMARRFVRAGLIPARAGNTRRATTRRAMNGAHPRSRGEHNRMVRTASRMSGSSPLARGTLEQRGKEDPTLGLIPARAGNTQTSLHLTCASRAHPRSRGEHQMLSATKVRTPGSSPLARGTPDSRTHH